jgi:hypothetical protein
VQSSLKRKIERKVVELVFSWLTIIGNAKIVMVMDKKVGLPGTASRADFIYYKRKQM